MEILDFGVWFQYFLLIISGCLGMMLILLVYTNKYIREKINQMEQNDESVDPFTEFH